MKNYIATYLFIILSVTVYSQPQINNWFFAAGNGLSFTSGNPVNIPGGRIGLMEGAAVISDKNGRLLFYTDGIHVWNRNHTVMANGQGLDGGSGSSSQSSVIVPKTRDGLQYYIFTTDEEGASKGFKYAIVDMSLNGGNGDVIFQSTTLITPACEKVTAVMNCNKDGYWVIGHKYGSDAFYSFMASDTGVNLTPVISHTGTFIPIAYATMAGCMKASPDGKKLACANGDLGIDLFDFNNQTGIISNGVDIFNIFPPGIPYGIEFSSNSSMLYVSVTHYWDTTDFKRYSGVFQFDVSLPTVTAIINSRVQLSRYAAGNEMGSLQRGPDTKIYMSQYQKSYLSVINAPNTPGIGCDFIDTGFPLASGGLFSLPNFINDYYDAQDSFLVTNSGLCAKIPIGFNYKVPGSIISILWNFDDPASGGSNTSTIYNPSHSFSSAGTYNVKLIKYGVCGNDTLTKKLTLGNVNVNLGNDTNFCEQSTIVLDPRVQGTNTYLWNNSSTGPTYNATIAGQYWVEVTNSNGCTKRDTIVLTTIPLPVINLGKDTTLCIGQTLLLDAQNAGAQYIWQNNTTQQTLQVNQSGKYWVDITMNGCKARGNITVSSGLKPVFSLGPDQYLCPTEPIQLRVNLSGVSYLWQDGSVNSTFLVSSEGIYYVDITNSCGTTRDSINIIKSSCKVYMPTAFTPNNDGLNDYFRIRGTGLITEYDMKIFNRWGEVVFKSKNVGEGWDGKYGGLDAPAGVYIYFISYKELNDINTRQLKGTATLIR